MIALGIDCGTQGLKTVALDHDSGEILASASRSYGLIGGLAPGHPAIHFPGASSPKTIPSKRFRASSIVSTLPPRWLRLSRETQATSVLSCNDASEKALVQARGIIRNKQ
jgi:hypothetical protein